VFLFASLNRPCHSSLGLGKSARKSLKPSPYTACHTVNGRTDQCSPANETYRLRRLRGGGGRQRHVQSALRVALHGDVALLLVAQVLRRVDAGTRV